MTKTPPRTPWWEELPEDFSRQAETTDVGDSHSPLSVYGTALLDRFVRVSLASAVALAMAKGRAAARDFGALRFYESIARTGDAAQAFLRPRRDVRIQRRPLPASPLMRDVQRYELRFASPYKPLNPAAAPGFERMTRNNVAHAQHWCHGDEPRPTLIVVHGFGLDAAWLNAQALSLERFYRDGYDILLFTYPYHGRRREPGDLFNGYGVFANGLMQFNETSLHAAHDLRVFMDHLEERGVQRMGITGISLGGYMAAQMATVEDRLSFCIPIVPAVSPVDGLLEWQPAGMLLSKVMRRQGVSVAQMRGLVAVHNPLTYAPRMDADRVLIIAGAGDRFTMPRHVSLLHRHWPGSALHWFPGNHLVHLGRGQYMERMRVHVDRCFSSDQGKRASVRAVA
jgi:pimeloyl-ACP methyl ester carboxylesterase